MARESSSPPSMDETTNPGGEAGAGRVTGSPPDDLAFIRRMMEESRQVAYSGRDHGILWSVLITAALVVDWANLTYGFGIDQAGWIWIVAVGLGWILSTWIGIREDRRSPVRTPTGRILAGIWIGCGAACTLIGFAGSMSGTLTSSGAILGPMCCVIGMAYLASSTIYGGTALWRALAAGWYLGAVALFLWPGSEALLIMAGLVIVLNLIPMLRLPKVTPGTVSP